MEYDKIYDLEITEIVKRYFFIIVKHPKPGLLLKIANDAILLLPPLRKLKVGQFIRIKCHKQFIPGIDCQIAAVIDIMTDKEIDKIYYTIESEDAK